MERYEDPDKFAHVQTVLRGGVGRSVCTEAEQRGREGAAGESAETSRGATAVSALAGLTMNTYYIILKIPPR